MAVSEPFERLTRLFGRFPGVGDKTARRFVLFLLQQPSSFAVELGDVLNDLRSRTVTCSRCGNLSTQDPCSICMDPLRDRSTLCVLETVEDMISMEQAGVYQGLYFILGGRVSPLDGEDVDPERLADLAGYVETEGFEEVILATSPRIEGDLTSFTVLEALEGKDARITRLAFGLPLGGSIGYADRVTLHASIESRVEARRNNNERERRE